MHDRQGRLTIAGLTKGRFAIKNRERRYFSFSVKLFASHLLAVFLVSGSVGTFFYYRAFDNLMRSLQSRLKNSAAMVSQGIDARDLAPIRSEGDTGHPAYLESLAKLRRVRRSNPDIAYLYIMRKTPEGISFVVDSDDSEAQALPGRVYTEETDSLLRGFLEASVDDQLTEDEWGTFLSGYGPLLNGEGEYLVGVDMRADEVRNKLADLRMTGAISLLASILLALLFALYLSRNLTRRVQQIAACCKDLGLDHLDARIEGRTFDEFDDLAEAFNQMGVRLKASRQELDTVISALSDSRASLETRVAERTRELEDATARMNVLRGLLPICCSCKKIRDDQGYWQQVERVVSDRADVRFTHGICPDCSSKLYGSLLDEVPSTVLR